MTLFKTLKDLNARRHTALVANGSRDVTNFMPQNDKEDGFRISKKMYSKKDQFQNIWDNTFQRI